MKTTLKWDNGMVFDVASDSNHIQIDAKSPIGKGSAMTPKELVLAGLGGCTAMDVIALLKKHKQPFESFTVDVDVTPSEGKHPVVFLAGLVEFHVAGRVDKDILLESVRLSQTKFCGVSAMLSKAFPIKYKVRLNGEFIGEGMAEFKELA
jgi:putative redox protein